jgi:hypothetical protein
MKGLFDRVDLPQFSDQGIQGILSITGINKQGHCAENAQKNLLHKVVILVFQIY